MNIFFEATQEANYVIRLILSLNLLLLFLIIIVYDQNYITSFLYRNAHERVTLHI